MNFEKLGLVREILDAASESGYTTPTPIQLKTIPPLIAGRDVIGCAQTGTGKTAAFAMPTLQRLMRAGKPNSKGKRKNYKRPIRSLILSPTRELALQISKSFSEYGRFTKLRNVVVYGGVKKGAQINALENGVDILVATPGRLLDLMQQGYIDLSRVEILILDEADQMLDMGFLPDLKRIVRSVPKQRQTLMFSATMPTEIRELANQWLKNPEHIAVSRVSSAATKVKQSVYFVPVNQKIALLNYILDNSVQQKTLVFSRTKHGAEKIVRKLKRNGVYAAAIHSNKTQNARQKVLESFKSRNPPVLVATDIAARGLDINGISHVINFDLPEVAENYVHRIGRTGRAGARGVAISFCAEAEKKRLVRIQRLTKKTIDVVKTPYLGEFETPAPGGNSQRPKKKDWAAIKKNKPKKRFYGSRGSVDKDGNELPKPAGGAKKGRRTKSKKNDGGTGFAKKERNKKKSNRNYR